MTLVERMAYCGWGIIRPNCTSAMRDMRLHLLHLCRCFTKWRIRSRACFTRTAAAVALLLPRMVGEGAMAM